MIPARRLWLRRIAAIAYSTAIGALVAALFWQTFRRVLPPGAVFAAGGVLGIRVTTLYASATAAAILNWRAIWIGGGSGLIAMVAAWPPASALTGSQPPVVLTTFLIAASVTAAAAEWLPARKGRHLYDSARFARFVHHLQGVLLFGMVLPASIAWTWPRPYAVAVIVSAFLLWKMWDACPVTLAENEARSREGRPLMPPESGFVPDVLGRLGLPVSGEAVGLALYAIGFTLCGWYGVEWLLGS